MVAKFSDEELILLLIKVFFSIMLNYSTLDIAKCLIKEK